MRYLDHISDDQIDLLVAFGGTQPSTVSGRNSRAAVPSLVKSPFQRWTELLLEADVSTLQPLDAGAYRMIFGSVHCGGKTMPHAALDAYDQD